MTGSPQLPKRHRTSNRTAKQVLRHAPAHGPQETVAGRRYMTKSENFVSAGIMAVVSILGFITVKDVRSGCPRIFMATVFLGSTPATGLCPSATLFHLHFGLSEWPNRASRVVLMENLVEAQGTWRYRKCPRRYRPTRSGSPESCRERPGERRPSSEGSRSAI